MAVRQYIGARYVPKFGGEWDINEPYEPLTIVTHLNNSYTSKKTVPPGISYSNTEYWALTGNFNAQIEQFIEDLADVQADLLDTDKKLDDFIDLTTQRKYILIGDSYNNPSRDGGWGGHVINNMGLTLNTDVWNT